MPQKPPIDERRPRPAQMPPCKSCGGTIWNDDESDLVCVFCGRMDADYHGEGRVQRYRVVAGETKDDGPLLPHLIGAARLVPPDKEELRRLWVDEGMSAQAIANKIGRAPTTIQFWLGRYGLLELRPRRLVGRSHHRKR